MWWRAPEAAGAWLFVARSAFPRRAEWWRRRPRRLHLRRRQLTRQHAPSATASIPSSKRHGVDTAKDPTAPAVAGDNLELRRSNWNAHLRTISLSCRTAAADCRPRSRGASACSSPAAARGLGNARFATATNRAPRKVQPGEPGEEKFLPARAESCSPTSVWSGFPNAGKSTLIARISAARPRLPTIVHDAHAEPRRGQLVG